MVNVAEWHVRSREAARGSGTYPRTVPGKRVTTEKKLVAVIYVPRMDGSVFLGRHAGNVRGASAESWCRVRTWITTAGSNRGQQAVVWYHPNAEGSNDTGRRFTATNRSTSGYGILTLTGSS